MKEKLIELLGLEADASEDEILFQVQQLKRLTNSPGAKQEKQIREKMAAGLSREAAIQVLQDQAADDQLREERDVKSEKAAKVEAERLAKVKAAASAPAQPNP